VFDWLQGAAAAGSLVAGVTSLLDDPDPPQGSAELMEGSRRAREISDILSNPNDPRFLQLVDQEEGRIRGDFASSLKQLRIANQRATARGGAPMLNPERRDETMARATAWGMEEARNRARENARAYLMASAQANQMSMGGFAQSAGIDGGLNSLNRMNRANAMQAAFGGAYALGQPAPTTKPGQQTVGGKLFGNLFGGGNMLNGGQNPYLPSQQRGPIIADTHAGNAGYGSAAYYA